MSGNIWIGMSIIALLPVLILNSLITPEVLDYPLYKRRQKFFWLLVLWLVPYAGFFLLHKRLGIGWASGKNSGGGDTINVTEGGSNGGGSE